MLTYGFNLVVNPCTELVLIDINKKLIENRFYDMPIFIACGLVEENIKFVVPSYDVPLTAEYVDDVIKKIFPREVGEPVCVNNFREIKLSDYEIICQSLKFGKDIPTDFYRLPERFGFGFKERYFDWSKETFKFAEFIPEIDLSSAEKNISSQSLKDELDKIFDSSNVGKFTEHPVHYVVKATSRESAKNIVSLLATALYENKHLISRRVSWFSNIKGMVHNDFRGIFTASLNSTVVFECPDDSDVIPSDLEFSGRLALFPVKGNEIFPFLKYLVQRNHENTLFILVEITDDKSQTNQLIELVKDTVNLVTIYGE